VEKSTFRGAAALVLALAGLAGCALPGGGAAGAGADGRTATIQRTANGVAHIQAPDLETLAYGMAYAYAQNNVCMVADHLLTVRGERSRHFAHDAMAAFGLRRLSNAQIDLFVAATVDDAELARLAAGASPEVQALERGYVAGYNRFLADHQAADASAGRSLPAACRGQPWVQPMTAADFRRDARLFSAILGGAGAFAEAMLGARPPEPAKAAAVPAPPIDVAAAAAQMREAGLFDVADTGVGSNAWAFGRSVTADGRGMLLGNPHFPWTGMQRFWQVHLTVPGVMDVMGASIGTFPMVAIGFNKDIAWSHTVSTGTRFTLHELSLVPGDPTSYLVDGQPEKMRARTVSHTVKAADGTLAVQSQTVWSTRWGPVVVNPRAGLNWTRQRAYALQDAMAADHQRSYDAYLRLARAASVQDIRQVLRRLPTTFNNTIAADRAGEALYADASTVPDIDAAMLERCKPSAAAAALRAGAGLVVLDGSRADCQWRQDTSSARPGLIPLERAPVLQRQDWVQNANDSHVFTHPAARLAGLSPLHGDDTVRSVRTHAALLQVPELVARGPVTLQAIQQQLFSNRNHMGEVVLPDLLAACAEPGVPGDDARVGCAVLRAWDRRSDADSRGAHLFREFWREARLVPGRHRVPADPARPATTPMGLDMAKPEVAGKLWAALDTAVKRLRGAGIALDAPLGSLQRAVFSDQPIPVHGGEPNEGVLNYVLDRGAAQGVRAQGYRIEHGTSYVQTVGFDARGPVAFGLLTYGQSTDPASPHATDQLRLYGAKQWPWLPFHADDVARERVGEAVRLTRP
jgi:acyl-homoserine-lactone acylase